ncbi:MAG: glycosyltransferase [Bacteroidota bacterium]|nr:glycosyltransferase [Bacteroidota bacterium]
MSSKHRIIVSVTSDLSTDQRVHRSCLALQSQGFDVLLIGRELPGSIPVPSRPYASHRFRLWFHKGMLFYASYNIRLFFYLLFSNTHSLFANDLDTLPANYLVSVLRKKLLVYDSHEYYTGVPELEHRPIVKSIWKAIERWIFPGLKIIITVNDSIANLYGKEYGKQLVVIRNVPIVTVQSAAVNKSVLRSQLGLPLDKKLVILQGSGINVQRGAEEAVISLRYLDDVNLILLGGGDVLPALNALVIQYQLEDKIIFKPRMPYKDMMQYTAASDLGLTFDKDTNLNYRFSLPNKIFDYIQAGIPVLASRLPEVAKVITTYDIGDFIENHDPEHIAKKIKSVLGDDTLLARWGKNLHLASKELNWESESKKFPDIIHERY